jgi:DNA (cytosine-5)-methyltransferase 1
MIRVLDLFSGIGGFALGLEATGGFRTVAFCECEPAARRVLARHWPEVRRYHDVRHLTAARLAADGIVADAVVGGFPCQDVSVAGLGAGLDGERSGLWREMRRIIGEVRPRWCIAENVPALRSRGADEVLGDLEALGYAAWPHVVGALHVGAPHPRKRVWIVGYSDAPRIGWPQGSGARQECAGRPVACDVGKDVADTDRPRLEVGVAGDSGRAWADGRADALRSGWWAAEPGMGRVAHGVPDRLDRLHGLGNAVVPAVVMEIGRAILAVEAALASEVAA